MSYYYYHYDAQGNVVAVTNSDGAVYRQYVYDPYGNIISVKDGSGTTVNISSDPGFNHAYTYRGYRFDSETGLYFLQSRYYAAGIGRFLTKDTFKGAAEDPQTLNRYVYAVGDPVNYVDHDGHRPAVGGGPEGLDVAINAGRGTSGPTIIQSGPTIIQGGPKFVPSHVQPNQVAKDYSPDYRAYTIGVGVVVGGGITYTVDKDDNKYVSVHADIGKSYTLLSGSIVDGYIYNATTSKELPKFLTGLGRNACYGFGGGVGLSSPLGSDLKAIETGGYFPQFGVSVGYTRRLPW